MEGIIIVPLNEFNICGLEVKGITIKSEYSYQGSSITATAGYIESHMFHHQLRLNR